MQILVEELERPMAIQWERRMTDDEYFQFCADNPDLRIERSAEGDILIMPPVGGESSFRNSELTAELRIWARKDGRGRVFDSSVEYFLPSGAAYSPDGTKGPSVAGRRHTAEQGALSEPTWAGGGPADAALLLDGRVKERHAEY